MNTRTFAERRNELLENLRVMAQENSTIAPLYDACCGYFESGAISPDVNSPHSIISSICVSSEDPRKPAYWNWQKYPDRDIYDSEYHVRTRWSVLLKKLVQWGFLPADYPVERTAEYIGNSWVIESDFTFKLEDDAVEVYDREDFGSCMHGKGYVQWYTENPDVVKVVGIYKGGNYVGRALLWNVTDEDGQETKYLDRVYPSDGGAHTRAVRTWADSSGWLSKPYDDRDDEDREFTVTMKVPSNDYYPYMDTFKYAYYDDGEDTIRISTHSRLGNEHHTEILNSTSGDGPPNSCTCERCGCRVLESDTQSILVSSSDDYEVWCDDCASYNSTHIPTTYREPCSVAAGYSVPNDEVVELHDGREVTRWDEIAECECSGEFYWLEDMGTTSLSDRLVAYDYMITLSNGETCVVDERDEFLIVEVDGEFHHIQDLMGEVGLDSEDVRLANSLYEAVKAGKTFEQVVFKHRFIDAFNSKLQLTEFSETFSKKEERVA